MLHHKEECRIIQLMKSEPHRTQYFERLNVESQQVPQEGAMPKTVTVTVIS